MEQQHNILLTQISLQVWPLMETGHMECVQGQPDQVLTYRSTLDP